MSRAVLTIVRLFVRFQLVPQREGSRAAGMLADVRLRARRHMRQDDMIPQMVGFGEGQLAVLTLV
jgi:hypothetical protein